MNMSAREEKAGKGTRVHSAGRRGGGGGGGGVIGSEAASTQLQIMLTLEQQGQGPVSSC